MVIILLWNILFSDSFQFRPYIDFQFKTMVELKCHKITSTISSNQGYNFCCWIFVWYFKVELVHAYIQCMFLCPMKPFEDMIEHHHQSILQPWFVSCKLIRHRNEQQTCYKPKNSFLLCFILQDDRLRVNLRKRNYKE